MTYSYDLVLDGPLADPLGLEGRWMEVKENAFVLHAAADDHDRRMDDGWPRSFTTVTYHHRTVVANWPSLLERGETVVLNGEIELPLWCNELRVWFLKEPTLEIWDWELWRARPRDTFGRTIR